MRFTKPFWAGIGNGSITVAFRGWKTPTVVAGRPYRTGGGRIQVLSVTPVPSCTVTKVDATRAGYATPADVLAQVRTDDGRIMYRVEFRLLDEPDPREALAENADLSSDDVAEIADRLARLDAASKGGAWTDRTLRLIAQNPGRRAPDLAEIVGRETKPFKLDVRKLKNLGLTKSLKIGYELSPRGAAYLEACATKGDRPRPTG